MEPMCECGHVLDEHENDPPEMPCAVKGCPCTMFDQVPDEDEEK